MDAELAIKQVQRAERERDRSRKNANAILVGSSTDSRSLRNASRTIVALYETRFLQLEAFRIGRTISDAIWQQSAWFHSWSSRAA